jgi:YHS domain-containing protein
MIPKKTLVRAVVVLLMMATALLAQTAPALYTTKDHLALSGYDAVAYFKDGKPVAGKPEFSYKWMDATWHFSSAENREAFKQNRRSMPLSMEAIALSEPLRDTSSRVTRRRGRL